MMINKGLVTRLHVQSPHLPFYHSSPSSFPKHHHSCDFIFRNKFPHIPWRHQYSYILRAILSSQGCGRVGEKNLPTISVFGHLPLIRYVNT